ncbi:MAG: ParB N-terminal domain-containing protein, partial [Bacteroidales bacterium]
MEQKKEFWDISRLRGWDKNPRAIHPKDFERLKIQITRLGQYKPLLITPDGEVIGGNMRLKAYTELGIKDIWVSIVTPKDDKEKIEYALSDNDRAGFYVEDDLEKLIGDFPDLNWGDYAVDFREPRVLDDFIDSLKPKDEAPPDLLTGEPVSKLGEIYQLGRHKLMCGDSTKSEQVEMLMDGKKANMVFTDPPYNVNYGATMKDTLRHKVSAVNAGRTILNDHFKDRQDFYKFLYSSINAIKPFVTGDLYICMSSSELDTLQNAFRDLGGHFSTFIIWVKNSFTIGRSNYQRQYEPILYGWFEKSSHYWSGVRNLSDVIKSDDFKVDDDGQVWLRAENIPSDIWEIPRPRISK